MRLDRLLAEEQLRGDLAVRLARGHQPSHLVLASRERRHARLCGRGGPPGLDARAELAQRAPDLVAPPHAFGVVLPSGSEVDPIWWAEAMLASPPRSVALLMGVRNLVVAPFGLRRPCRGPTGFPVLARAEREVVLGLDDRHLDFRVSVLTRGRAERTVLVVSTLVFLRNALGRSYFAPVRHVHPLVVRTMLRRAVARAAPPCSGGLGTVIPRHG